MEVALPGKSDSVHFLDFSEILIILMIPAKLFHQEPLKILQKDP